MKKVGLLLGVIFLVVVWAQDVGQRVGTLRGQVVTQNLKPIEGAVVLLDGRIAAKTTKTGEFLLEGVPVGMHQISVDAGKLGKKVMTVLIREGFQTLDVMVNVPEKYEKKFAEKTATSDVEDEYNELWYGKFGNQGILPTFSDVVPYKRVVVDVEYERQDVAGFATKVGSLVGMVNFGLGYGLQVGIGYRGWREDNLDDEVLYSAKLKLSDHWYVGGWVRDSDQLDEETYWWGAYNYSRDKLEISCGIKGKKKEKTRPFLQLAYDFTDREKLYEPQVKAKLVIYWGKDWYGRVQRGGGLAFYFPKYKASIGVYGYNDEDSNSYVSVGVTLWGK